MAAILLVDDQRVSLMLLRQLISQLDVNHIVHTFTCPREALSWTTNNPVDLVVTDYKMPDMNGIEFVRAFRNSPGYSEVPVVMVTADDDGGVHEAARAAGVNNLLVKPVDHGACRELCGGLLAGL